MELGGVEGNPLGVPVLLVPNGLDRYPVGPGLGPVQSVEIKAGLVVERRRSIELQIVLTLEDVVENSEPAANRGLGIAKDVPCETQARRPIVLVGEVCALGRSGIARKDQAGGRVHKALALLAGYEAERSSLGIVFRLGIFVADAEIQRQPLAHVEVVLRVTRNLVRSNVIESVGALKVVVRQAKKKVGQIGAGSGAVDGP